MSLSKQWLLGEGLGSFPFTFTWSKWQPASSRTLTTAVRSSRYPFKANIWRGVLPWMSTAFGSAPVSKSNWIWSIGKSAKLTTKWRRLMTPGFSLLQLFRFSNWRASRRSAMTTKKFNICTNYSSLNKTKLRWVQRWRTNKLSPPGSMRHRMWRDTKSVRV